MTKFPVTMKRAPNKRNKKMEINVVKTDAPGFVELNFSMKIALTRKVRVQINVTTMAYALVEGVRRFSGDQ